MVLSDISDTVLPGGSHQIFGNLQVLEKNRS